MSTWRLARSLQVFRGEVNSRWGARDKRSDGSIGDAEHAARSSDHNPWVKLAGLGIVRAVDIDKDLTTPATDPRPAFEAEQANWLAEFLRDLGQTGDPRLTGGGYVIWNRRIAGGTKGWAWHRYDGLNSHEHHVHLSVSLNPAGFDSPAGWGLWPLRQTTSAPIREDDDLTPDERRMLAEIHDEMFKRLETRVDGNPVKADADGVYRDTILGYAANSDAAATRVERYIRSDEFRDRIVDGLLNRTLPTPTWRDGQVVTEDTPVKLILPRAGAASVTRHRQEQK